MVELTEKVLRRYLRENPTSTLFARYAELLLEREKDEEAYLLCIHGVKANPKFATGWLILGKAAFRRGENIFAKRCWMNALAADKMCLQAARLLLTTEELHLTVKEAYTAAMALLNVDSNHLLARTTIKLIDKRQTGDSGGERQEEDSDESPGSSPALSDREARSPEATSNRKQANHLTRFDLYGKDKQHLEELVNAIEEISHVQSADQGKQKNFERAQRQSEPDAAIDTEVPQPRELREHLNIAVEKDNAAAQSGRNAPPEEVRIPNRMATLTFVRVLKSQGLYENALTVLKMIQPDSTNREEIAQEKQELTRLMETQKE